METLYPVYFERREFIFQMSAKTRQNFFIQIRSNFGYCILNFKVINAAEISGY